MPSKSVSLVVVTMDAELEFSIQSSTTGKQLFDQVVRTIGLREVWYFGLQYKDTKGSLTWLKLNKKVLSHDIVKEIPLRLKFKAKYYPEDVSDEIIQDITLRMFYLQVKNSILNEEIYCPPETCVLLASYATQIKYGDYSTENYQPGCLSNDKLLPRKVIDQFEYSESEWHEKIVHWYQEHVGMLREEAMMEYLKIAQDLEMYGVNYFEIKNKKSTELWLGVDALGLNIYEKEDKMTPRIGFPWSEIRNISFNDKKFVIKPVDRKAPDVIFFVARLKTNKRILALCMGNHELYMRRRKVDSIEVQQMKAQAQEEKIMKEKEREALLNERHACMLAIQEKNELLQRLCQLEQDAANTKNELEKQTRLTRDLEEKRLKAEEEKRTLELEMQLAEQEHRKALERAKLDREEIEKRENKIQNLRKEINMREQNLDTELMQRLSIINGEKASNEEIDESDDMNRQNDIDFLLDESLPPEQYRETAIDKNFKMKQQLEELRKDLTIDTEKQTREDQIHQENVKEGRDKYRTLKQVRQGNTKKRVDEFESL